MANGGYTLMEPTISGNTAYPERMRKTYPTAAELLDTNVPASADYTPQASIATELQGTMPIAAPTLKDTISGFMDRPIGEDRGTVLGISRALAELGATQTQNPYNPYFGAATKVAAGLIGGVQTAEAKKKMTAQALLAGQRDPMQGPAADFGISGLEALGLTPDQITGMYDTALAAREKERQFPLTAMTAMGDFYNKVTTGDYHAAQVPYLRAQANKMLAETEYLPYKQALEMREKLAEIDSKLAGTEKTRAETVTERGRPAEISARTEKTREETAGLPGERRRVAAEAGKTEEQTRQLRYGLPVGVMNQQMYMKLNEQLPYNFSHDGKSLYVGNQRTGAVNVIPNGTATPDAKVTQLAWSMVSSSFLEQAKADLMAKHPGETQKAREEYEQLLFVLSKEGMTTDAQASAVRGALTPANRVKFNRAMDVYRDGEQKGWSLETMERVVQDELGQKPAAKAAPAAPSAAPAPGKPVASTAAPTKSVAGQSPKAQGFVNVAPASVESKLRKMATDAKQTLTNGRRYQDPETKEVYYYFGDKFYAK